MSAYAVLAYHLPLKNSFIDEITGNRFPLPISIHGEGSVSKYQIDLAALSCTG